MYKYLELYEYFIDKDHNQKSTLDKLITKALTTSYMSTSSLQSFVEFLLESIENEKYFNEDYMLFGLSILSSHASKYNFELPILDVYKMFSTDFDHIMKRAEELYDSELIVDTGFKEDRTEKYKEKIKKSDFEDKINLSSEKEYREEIEKKINNIFSAGEDLDNHLRFIQKNGGSIISYLNKLEFEVRFNRFIRDKK